MANAAPRSKTCTAGVLCGLEVQLRIWEERFDAKSAGPLELANFIISHMKSGMERVHQIAQPEVTDLASST